MMIRRRCARGASGVAHQSKDSIFKKYKYGIIMKHVTILTRPGCHLCEDAKAVLEQLSNKIPLELEIINIDQNPSLYNEYKDDIPVIFLNGKEIGRHRIQEDEIAEIFDSF